MNSPLVRPSGGDSALVSESFRATVNDAGPVHRLLTAFRAGRRPTTLRAYQHDLEDFQAFCQARTVAEAAGRLLLSGPGPANALALGYKDHLQRRGLASATVNRRLAALRSLLKLGRTLGVCTWSLEVAGLRSEPYRDTKGPGALGFRRMLLALQGDATGKGTRDRAILRLLFDLALRRSEVTSLDMEHVDLDVSTVAVLGKGRTARIKLTLPAPTRAALAAWCQLRGGEPGPLFTNVDRARKGRRLTPTSVYRLVRDLGRRVGLVVRPHGLRHSAITSALDLGGDLRAVQRFSRHRDVRVLQLYDDNRKDLGGQVARMVASLAGDE